MPFFLFWILAPPFFGALFAPFVGFTLGLLASLGGADDWEAIFEAATVSTFWLFNLGGWILGIQEGVEWLRARSR